MTRSTQSVFPILIISWAISLGIAPHAAAQSSHLTEHGSSATVIGANPLLADGAVAMLSGDYERGIELTREGLNGPLSREDRSAGLTNMCAAYAALRRFSEALPYCNQALELDTSNWRTWQNRAAAHYGLGKLRESLEDIERGMTINPDSSSLKKSLAIVRERERLQQQKVRELVES